jgi:hypothetical protein
MHRPQTKIEREMQFYATNLAQKKNQAHENQYIGINGEFVKLFCSCR